MGPAEQAHLLFYHLVSLSRVSDADSCRKAHINERSRVGNYGFQFRIAARAYLAGVLGFRFAHEADGRLFSFDAASLGLCHFFIR